ncbi:coiled-coil domain-containing protein 43-like [Ylistrum balloti]|uniref:coiled-coil domain-containing protein 43-like n=1 Tax=Ylistrum balloti TaxID=509963 RepID=UPI00290584AC|nr:coiled-coil domain-containing protein 43-like [Ylistrum balloti]
MATSTTPYDQWLADKLLSLNPEVDTDVFVMYISSMLDEDSPADEKRESILELLAEVLETDREQVCDDIIKKYEEIHNETVNKNTESAQKNIADQLSNMLEKQTIEPVKVKDTTSDEARARKEAILAQYSTVSDEEDDDGPSSHTGTIGAATSGSASAAAAGDSLLMKNTNAESVGLIEKEKREKAKEEADKKKEKDKQDRAQQKQKNLDRKEAEKKRTQKGERRR